MKFCGPDYMHHYYALGDRILKITSVVRKHEIIQVSTQ